MCAKACTYAHNTPLVHLQTYTQAAHLYYKTNTDNCRCHSAPHPSSTLHHSPCHIAEDVGADHHASPAPHLFPLFLQPLLQGLLQEHLRDEQRHGRQGVTETERDTEREVWFGGGSGGGVEGNRMS